MCDLEESTAASNTHIIENRAWANLDHCAGCGQKFTLLFRRHHCRKCLQSFCYRCCAGTETRLCDGCQKKSNISVHDTHRWMSTDGGVPVLDAMLTDLIHTIATQGDWDASWRMADEFQAVWTHIPAQDYLSAIRRLTKAMDDNEQSGLINQSADDTAAYARVAESLIAMFSQFIEPKTWVRTAVAASVHWIWANGNTDTTVTLSDAVRKLAMYHLSESFADVVKMLQDLQEDLSFSQDELCYDESRFGFANEGDKEDDQCESNTIKKQLAEFVVRVENMLQKIHSVRIEGASMTIPLKMADVENALRGAQEEALELMALATDVMVRTDDFLHARMVSRDRFHSTVLEEDEPESDKEESMNGGEASMTSPVPLAQQERGPELDAARREHRAGRLRALLTSPLRFAGRRLRSLLPDVEEALKQEIFVGWNNQRKADEYRRRFQGTMTRHNISSENLRRVLLLRKVIADLQSEGRSGTGMGKTTRQELSELYPDLLSDASLDGLCAGETKGPHLVQRCEALLQRFPPAYTEAAVLSERLEKAEVHRLSAEKTRAAYRRGCGGESVALRCEDGVVLDGMFFSVSKFLTQLREAGGQRFSIRRVNSTEVRGYCFAKSVTDMDAAPRIGETARALLETLEGLGCAVACGLGTRAPQGRNLASRPLPDWMWIDTPSYVLLGPFTFVGDAVLDLIKNAFEFHHAQNAETDELCLKREEILTPHNPDDTFNNGTIILMSGAIGVYEAQKREIMAFLVRGVNVMAFNFRGYGLSEGIPSKESIKMDAEAAFQYLHTQRRIPPHRIVVKTLCMSGAAGAHLAAQHSGVHLLLDQTYADFGDYLEKEVRRFLRQTPLFRMLPSHLSSATEWVVSEVVKSFAPQWNVANEMHKVSGGCVGVLITDSDVNTPKEQAYDNIRRLREEGRCAGVRSYVLPGKHAALWLDCVRAPDGDCRQITMDRFSTSVARALQRQCPSQWRRMQALIEEYQASIAAGADAVCVLVTLTEVLNAIHPLHEESEVAISELRLLCYQLVDKHRRKVVEDSSQDALIVSLSSSDKLFSREPSYVEGGGSFNGTSSVLVGRQAVDDFLAFANVLSPLPW